MSILNTFGDLPGQLSKQSLWELPTIITEPGSYVTRAGESVEVTSILPPGRLFRCMGQYANGIRERWHTTGRVFDGRVTANDIVSKLG